MLCQIHNAEMKLIPAGVSKKTGRPYDAFYACQIKDCKWRPQQEQNYAPRSNSEPSRGSGGVSRNWDKEAYEKCCSIWAAAMYQSDVSISNITEIIRQGELWSLFQAIRADADKRFATGWAKAEATFKPSPAQMAAGTGSALSDDFEAGNAEIDRAMEETRY